MNLNYLVVIPARKGSKRLANKNSLKLAGKPLISWTIDLSMAIFDIDKIIVSTDSSEIIHIANQHGLIVPWLRPSELASDNSTTSSVLKHALTEYENKSNTLIDAVVLLQPTSPFRNINAIHDALGKYESSAGNQCLVSVSPFRVSPYWALKEEDEGRFQSVLGWKYFQNRSQDLPDCYAPNGSLYIIPRSKLFSDDPLINNSSIYFKMDKIEESIDIDDIKDFMLAEIIAKNIKN